MPVWGHGRLGMLYKLFVLLVGGDKRTQDADIKNAKEYWGDWKPNFSY
jgi:putative component of toxin-antitoxin plasmid stabilization module